jgi:SAM-dependent methyltransferase
MNPLDPSKGERYRSYREARHPLRERGRDLFLAGRFGKEIRLLVSDPRRVLVLGSADGKEVSALQSFFPQALVVAMDLSEAEIEELESKESNLVLGDWNSPPFPPKSFDLAVFFAALHHASSLDETFRSVASILKPGGWVYATHEPMASLILGTSQRSRMKEIGEEVGGIETSPRLREYRESLRAAGFVDIRVEASGLNLVRLLEMGEGFEDTRARRSDWPERLSRALAKLARPFGEKKALNLIFLIQRLTFGLFGVTLCGRKPHER